MYKNNSRDNIGYAFRENSYRLEIGGFQEKEYKANV